MTKETEQKPCTGLRRTVAIGNVDVINRPPRQPISGVAYNAQKRWLVPDRPDAAGNERYACKIADVSEHGFGVVCREAANAPDLFQAGALMTLVAQDGKRSRVEICWVKNGRLGTRRSSDKPR